MSDYFGRISNTVHHDDLFAGPETPVRIENVSIKGGAEFSRGCILAGTSGLFEPVKVAADAEKVLVIAAEDFSSDSSETAVTSVYTSGDFHTEKLSTGASVVSAADFKEPLRKVGILQTALKEIF